MSYIRADETPHVEYLKTVLSEMRDRTFVGTSGTKHAGSEMIGRLWDRSVANSLGVRREANIKLTMNEVAHARSRDQAPRRHPRAVPRHRRCRCLEARDGPGRRHHLLAAPQRGRAVRFGIFYEHQLPRPWTDDSERQLIQDALDQVELADALGFDVRVGGRAPLPRGVLALVCARGVPRRRVAAHEEHPPRSRHRADAAAVQPSGAHRRAHRDARPRVERAGRVRHRRVVVGGRAGRLRHRPRARSGRCGRRVSRSRCAA